MSICSERTDKLKGEIARLINRIEELEGELRQEEEDSDHYCKLVLKQRTALEELCNEVRNAERELRAYCEDRNNTTFHSFNRAFGVVLTKYSFATDALKEKI